VSAPDPLSDPQLEVERVRSGHRHRVIDADGHVVEPPGLFAPWCPPGRHLLDLPPTTPMIPCGDADAVADQLEHGFDGPSYVRALDRQRIAAAVVYPSLGLFAPFLPELDDAESEACARAYNEWVAGWCAAAPGRLFASGVLPQRDPARAAAVAAAAADLGLVAVMVRPNPIGGRVLGDAAFDALYEVVADRGLVLAVHEGLGVRAPTMGSDRFTTFVERHLCSHPMEQMTALASLVVGGALERHPSLTVAFLESGTGWLAWWLHRLGEHVEWMAASECAHLSLTPAEYFARQCVISTDPDDDVVGGAIKAVGADHVMWASDFPHPDAVYPGAVDAFVRHASANGIGYADLDTVFWSTPERIYRLGDRLAVLTPPG